MARSVKIKTIVTAFGDGDPRANLLPDKDKVSIMEYLLQRPEGEVRGLIKDTKPCFVTTCAQLLLDRKLDVYFSVLKMIKNEERV